MKKTLIITLMCILLISLTGCKNKELSTNELGDLQDLITEKTSSLDYNNMASCYINETNEKIIVELVNNSEQEQDWFKQNIMDSEYIEFIQGGPYTTSNPGFSLKRSSNVCETAKYKKYYEASDRTIYFIGCIDEFNVYSDDKKVSLKEYLTKTFQTIDDGIKNITDQLEQTEIFKDGGTSVYKSKEKDITMIVCKTIDGNKDIYIGSYNDQYEENYCHN